MNKGSGQSIGSMAAFGLAAHAREGAVMACGGFIGKAILPAAAVVGASSMGTVALACATGAFIVFLPVAALKLGLASGVNKIRNPCSSWLLTAALSVGSIVAAAALGAALFGLAINPVMYCALAGGAVLKVAFYIVSLFSRKDQSLASMRNHASYSFWAPRAPLVNREEALNVSP